MRLMKSSVLMLAAISFSLTAPVSAFAASLIVDGGFESTGDISFATYAGDVQGGTNPLPGWVSSAAGKNVEFTGVESVTGPDTMYATHGGANSLISGAPSADGAQLLSQTFGDVAGLTTTYSFYLENEVGSGLGDSFSFSVDGTCLICSANIAQSGAYSLYTGTFTSTGSDTILFTMTNEDEYFSLDDVSVTQPSVNIPPSATPEPSSLVLLGTGVLGLASATRRRFLKA